MNLKEEAKRRVMDILEMCDVVSIGSSFPERTYTIELKGNDNNVNYNSDKASERPTIRMTCMSCGYKERSKFARIKNCPECDGLLVDPYDRDIMDKVLEKAGYIRRTDKQEQSLLSITLQDESSVPTVTYKGEELKGKRAIQFDWETSDVDSMGGLSYTIEHIERSNNHPAVNRIERRVRNHV